MNFTKAISNCAVNTIRGISTLAIISIGTMTSQKANAEDHLIRCQRSGSKFFNVKYEANAPSLTLGGTFILEWHDPRAVNRRIETYQCKKDVVGALRKTMVTGGGGPTSTSLNLEDSKCITSITKH